MYNNGMYHLLSTLLSAWLFLTFSGCARTDNAENVDTPGSAGFSVAWPNKGISDSELPTITCKEYGIVTVTVDILDTAGNRIAKESFDCAAGEGLIKNIPPGQNRKFVISGRDATGNIIYQGSKEGIEIVSMIHNDVGLIPINPTEGFGITSTTPVDNSVNVGLRTIISATFSQVFDANSINARTFLVNDGSSNISGTINYTGEVVSFIPTHELDHNKTYTITLTTGVRDIDGNSLADPFIWTFTSLENDSPTVLDIYPKENARGVGIFPTITVTFSEPMNPKTVTTESFQVEARTGNSDMLSIDGHVSYNAENLTAVFSPNENLPCNSDLKITVSNQIEDAVGNRITGQNEWHFTTAERCGPQIVTGGTLSVALKANGMLWAWGMGYGSAPEPIGYDSDWAAVAAGGILVTGLGSYSAIHIIALKTDGTLWTWGDNNRGQLGDDRPKDRTDNLIPVQIGYETDWSKVAAGTEHSLALKTDGTLWAWGNNRNGQLGDGTYSNKYIPVQIGTDSNWAAMAAGASYTVALKTDGSFWAWGSNYYGQHGDGTFEDKTTPTQIGRDTNWVKVVADDYNVSALKNDGSLWAWGSNSNGQLGDGTAENKNIPTRIGVDNDWKEVAIGMALKNNGSLWIWDLETTPTQIDTGTNWEVVTSYYRHRLALKTDGSLWAWGNNSFGQLGDGFYENRSEPIQVIAPWISVTIGYQCAIALRADGTIWASGANERGQLGIGSLTDRSTPTQIGHDTDWIAASAGSSQVFALKRNGTLWAWGDSYGQFPTQIGTDTDWALVAGRDDHPIALKTDGTLWEWGESYGHVPTQIGTDKNWAFVAVGSHSMALKTDGTLWAWGNNDYGQLGDGTYESKTVPSRIGVDTSWTTVAVGGLHTLALKNDGTLWAWGNNQYGQLGDGTYEDKNVPTQIGQDETWRTVACGPSHSVATRNYPYPWSGELWTWGDNGYGVLGTSQSSNIPVQIGEDPDWTAIAAGWRTTFALKVNGKLWAWGQNHRREFGITESYLYLY